MGVMVEEAAMPQAIVEQEEIEGLGQEEPLIWGDYPIDTLLIRNETADHSRCAPED